MNLYKHSFCHFTMDLFSTKRNCAEDHINLRRDKKQKTPPRRGFLFGVFTVGSRKHTVLRQRKKYTRSGKKAQFSRRFLLI
ncbi:hypothetical protein FMJ32_02045 [Klebsiella michiganensis]|nr:hypothetical protein [Klebsiella michiganensis]